MGLLEHRRRDAESRVLHAIDMLRPEHCGPLNICRLAAVGYTRGAFALTRLTDTGVIEQAGVGNRTVYRRVAG